jgi:hypothetical protein
VHYAIIAGCAAAVLFAAIPDRTAPYRAAREDLDALRAIDWESARNEAKTKGLLMKNGAEGPLDLDSLRSVNQKVARGTMITAA